MITFYVRIFDTDKWVGELSLPEAPAIESTIQVNGKAYKVEDFSIGERLVDEIYVSEVEVPQ